MSSAIVVAYVCPCNPEFVYKTKSTYNAHKKSMKHVAYDSKRKEEAINVTRRDNEIDLMKRMMDSLTRENIKLKDENEILCQENKNLRTSRPSTYACALRTVHKKKDTL
jgi:hypothetical protein